MESEPKSRIQKLLICKMMKKTLELDMEMMKDDQQDDEVVPCASNHCFGEDPRARRVK